MKFIPKGPIDNTPALLQVMAWRLPGDKAITRTNDDLLYWRTYASLGRNELRMLWPKGSHCNHLLEIFPTFYYALGIFHFQSHDKVNKVARPFHWFCPAQISSHLNFPKVTLNTSRQIENGHSNHFTPVV